MTERQKIKLFLEKIVVNTGVGRMSQQSSFEDKVLPIVMKDLATISGQKGQIRKVTKSIAGFKIREGQVVGVRTTLRGEKMVDFFERLVRIVLPRVRDFTGLSLTNVDQSGVLNIGLKEHLVFPEINPEDSTLIFPLQVTVVPRHKDREKILVTLRELGVPLKK